jgi:hypothetical protein
MMHINPGASGNHGFHPISTAIRFKIKDGKMFEMEIWEQKRN